MRRISLSGISGREIVPAVLVILVFIHGATTSPYFLDLRYLLDRSSLVVETGLLALALTLVIVAGQIDLSVASTLALVACVVARMLEGGFPAFVALPFGIVLGAGLGYVNGLLVARLKLPSFMVTLGTMALYRGIAQVMVGDKSAPVPANLIGIDFLTIPGTPIPAPLVLFVAVAVVVGLILHRTTFGRRIFAVGTNERASFFSAVPTSRTTTLVFTIAGALSGLAGLVIASRLGVARFDHGRGTEVDAIAAVVLGGASIAGGRGTVLGTCIALLLVGLLRTDMGVANVTQDIQLAAVGGLLVVSVLATNLLERLGQRRSRAARASQSSPATP